MRTTRVEALLSLSLVATIAGCNLAAIRKEHADVVHMFAPQLRFDKAARTFPMSAQDYYSQVIATGSSKEKTTACDPPSGIENATFLFKSKAEECRARAYENTDANGIATGEYVSKDGRRAPIPTYYRVFECGRQTRILYWWFYGWQDECAPATVKVPYHHGDWERILVTLSEDRSRVAAVTYFQHSGHYTRLAEGGDANTFVGASYRPGVEMFKGHHPVVHVGKQQHGSYHAAGGTGADGVSFCGYFEDYRHNDGARRLWLDTWNDLVSLQEGAEPWMAQDALPEPGFRWGACEGANGSGCSIGQHPVRTSNGASMCDLKACDGFAVIATDEGGIPLGGIIAGAPSGCFQSQCQFHDNQSGWTPLHPGTCSHCPPGYTDVGLLCARNVFDARRIGNYGLDFSIPTTDEGLLRSKR